MARCHGRPLIGARSTFDDTTRTARAISGRISYAVISSKTSVFSRSAADLMLRERAAEVVGIDIDPLVRDNRLLDEAVVYDGGIFPFPDGRFDLAISRWVNEHLPDPGLHFHEVARVLAPGGLYVFRTVNLFHYKTIGAKLVPPRIQVPLVRWLAHMDADLHDPYPTYYRANTRRRIQALCKETGLRPLSIEMSESYPWYGKAFKALFILFMGYERLVNSSDRFEGLRHTMDCVLEKPLRAEG
jgi:SAM-dependent methyltransferase